MKKILIADDEPDILKIVNFRLKKQGHQITMAANGLEALKLIEQESPDLILLDVSMPGMKGDEVCKKLKEQDRFKHIPVVLMTASTQAVTEENIAKIGAQGFLLKPFETEEFLNTIEKFLN